MFVLADKMLFWWPVKVMVPAASRDEAGRFVEQVFQIQFEALERDTALALTEAMAAADSPTAVARAENEQIAAVVRNWSDVVTTDGTDVPFDAETLEAACQHGWFRAGVVRAYGEAMAGGAARLGN